MEPNEKLLWRVIQERSHHRRLLGGGSEWLLLGALVLVVLAAVPLVRTVAVGKPDASGGAAANRSEPALASVPRSAPTLSSAATAGVPAPTPDVASRGTVSGSISYVVQPGDTLQLIAARNGLRPATLASVNQLDQPDLLQPGRRLVIPPTDGVLYVVQPGETLRSIAERYGVDVGRLAGANDLEDPDHIPAGLVLFIPAETD